jgi:hypothetical protein
MIKRYRIGFWAKLILPHNYLVAADQRYGLSPIIYSRSHGSPSPFDVRRSALSWGTSIPIARSVRSRANAYGFVVAQLPEAIPRRPDHVRPDLVDGHRRPALVIMPRSIQGADDARAKNRNLKRRTDNARLRHRVQRDNLSRRLQRKGVRENNGPGAEVTKLRATPEESDLRALLNAFVVDTGRRFLSAMSPGQRAHDATGVAVPLLAGILIPTPERSESVLSPVA